MRSLVKNVRVETETSKSSISIDWYAFAIKIKQGNFDTWLTARRIPREISHHCSFFINEGGTPHLIGCLQLLPVATVVNIYS